MIEVLKRMPTAFLLPKTREAINAKKITNEIAIEIKGVLSAREKKNMQSIIKQADKKDNKTLLNPSGHSVDKDNGVSEEKQDIG